MEDIFITSLIHLAESHPDGETQITLLVGGFLVSGNVIGYEKFCANVPEAGEIDKIISENQEAAQPKSPERHFIHLSEAKYFHPGQLPVPNNMGVFCRIPVSAIQGFNMGSLSAARE